MDHRPLQNQSQSPSRKLSTEDLQGLDAQCRLLARVPGVKMRRRVIVVVESDDDPEKLADPRQGDHLLLVITGFPLEIRPFS
jgi:hypothetical protein